MSFYSGKPLTERKHISLIIIRPQIVRSCQQAYLIHNIYVDIPRTLYRFYREVLTVDNVPYFTKLSLRTRWFMDLSVRFSR